MSPLRGFGCLYALLHYKYVSPSGFGFGLSFLNIL